MLQRDKFGWPAAEAQETIAWISHIADVVEPKQAVEAIKDDPDDNRVLECAIAARSDYIVSGDKHLLTVKTSPEFAPSLCRIEQRPLSTTP